MIPKISAFTALLVLAAGNNVRAKGLGGHKLRKKSGGGGTVLSLGHNSDSPTIDDNDHLGIGTPLDGWRRLVDQHDETVGFSHRPLGEGDEIAVIKTELDIEETATDASSSTAQAHQEDDDHQPEKKIMGGVQAKDDKWTWFTSLRACKRDKNTGQWNCCQNEVSDDCWAGCGGALVAPGVVVTAAHCCESSGDFKLTRVRVGAWCHDADNCGRNYESAEIADVIKHPRYGPVRGGQMPQFDTCVLTLKDPIETIKPVEMDVTGILDKVGHFRDLEAAGFGRSQNNAFGGKFPYHLMEVNLAKLPHEYCEEQFPGNYNRESMECAGKYDAKSTCNGDSGGPIVSQGRRGSAPGLGRRSLYRGSRGRGGIGGTSSANRNSNANANPATTDDDDTQYLVGVTSWGTSSCQGGADAPSVSSSTYASAGFIAPYVYNSYEYMEDQPKWCRMCDGDYQGARPAWCNKVTPVKSSQTTTTTTTSTTSTTTTSTTTSTTTPTTTTPKNGADGRMSGSQNSQQPIPGGLGLSQEEESAATTAAAELEGASATIAATEETETTADADNNGKDNNGVKSGIDPADQQDCTDESTRKFCHWDNPNNPFCSCGYLADEELSARMGTCGGRGRAGRVCVKTCQNKCSPKSPPPPPQAAEQAQEQVQP